MEKTEVIKTLGIIIIIMMHLRWTVKMIIFAKYSLSIVFLKGKKSRVVDTIHNLALRDFSILIKNRKDS